MTADPHSPVVADFPRVRLLELLRRAKVLFSTDELRDQLSEDLGLAPATAEQQRPERHAPTRASDDGAPASEGMSARRFATMLVDQVAEPARLDSAVALARRAIAVLPEGDRDEWAGLVDELSALHLDHRTSVLRSGDSPDIATYQQWVGFECLHVYSLTDRFFGRDEVLAELDDWIADGGEVSVRCLCALGGAGKSAVAWRWVNSALTRLRANRFRGALWCSFYEKAFDFEDFLRRALAFCGQVDDHLARSMPLAEVERRLHAVLANERFVLVIDGLERVMNGYARVADRAVDEEGERADADLEQASADDRRLTDPRSAAFLRSLAAPLASRVLITTRLLPADLELVDDPRRRHVDFVDLPGLELNDAVALWTSIAPDCPVAGELEAVFQLCGHHPLVLSILARSVVAAGGSWDRWRRSDRHADFDPRGTPARARAHVIGICLRDLDDQSMDVLGVLTMTGKPMGLDELGEILRQGSIAHGEERWTVPDEIGPELARLVDLGFVGQATQTDIPVYDVHPVVRGAVWGIMTDPSRERFLDQALSELAATPDPQRALDLTSLSRVISVYDLLVGTGQWDRAWETLHHRLWGPLALEGASRELLDLFEQLLGEAGPLQLLPLSTRREQANAAGCLAELLLHVGESDLADVLLRWCAAIRLRINDAVGFLAARTSVSWQTLYHGELFTTEVELRRMKLQAIAFDALDLVGVLDSWIGLVMALRGDLDAAQPRFKVALRRTGSVRWWSQTVAEAHVHAGDAAAALGLLPRGHDRDDSDEDRTQIVWEDLTRGMAFRALGRHEEAMEELSRAVREARRIDYSIVECFALAALAELHLDRGDRAAAERLIDQYFVADPESRCQLAAADTWRVLARCQVERADRASAVGSLWQAYRLAACDGPPFVYAHGLQRVRDALTALDAYLPPATSRLPPDWSDQLREVEKAEALLAHDLRTKRAAALDGGGPPSVPERVIAGEKVWYDASDEDRRWLALVTGSHEELRATLLSILSDLGVGVAELRRQFGRSEHQSLEVLVYELIAENVIRPDVPRRTGDLDGDERDAWVHRVDEHGAALEVFLASPRARDARRPFALHRFDDRGVRAFLADGERRIDVENAPPPARRWWSQLRESRPPEDLLVLAECIQAVPATLSAFVDAISVTGERQLEYAFHTLDAQLAKDRLRVRSVSRTDGWSTLQIQLRLQAVKFQLGWSDLDEGIRDYWSNLEQANEAELGRVLQLAEELALRGTSVAEYYEALRHSSSDNLQANLCYLDHVRLARIPWDGESWPDDVSVQRWSYDRATPSFTDASTWSDDQVRRRLEVVRNRIGSTRATPSSQEWWQELEASTAPRTILRLAEELEARSATMADLHSAKIDAATDNVLSILAYLDFHWLRRIDRDTALSVAERHNNAGNREYEAGDYQSAIASYELAIDADPTEEVYHANLAGALEQEGDDPVARKRTALEALRRGIELSSGPDHLRPKARKIETWLGVYGRRGGPFSEHVSEVKPIIVEVSEALVLDGGADDLIRRTESKREELLAEFGLRVPGVTFRGDYGLAPGAYAFLLDEVPVETGQVGLGLTFRREVPDDADTSADDPTARDPLDGHPGIWSSRTEGGDAEALGPHAFVIRHLGAVLRENLANFLGTHDVITRIDEGWASVDPDDSETVARLAHALRALLQEGVPIVEFDALVEACNAGDPPAVGALDEALARMRALPAVRRRLPGNRQGDPLHLLDAAIEARVAGGLRPAGEEHVLLLDPHQVHQIHREVRSALAGTSRHEWANLVVDNVVVRRYVRLLLQDEFPRLHVIARGELLGEPEWRGTVTAEGPET